MRCQAYYLTGVVAALALAGCYNEKRPEPVTSTTQSADGQGLVVAESPDITKALDVPSASPTPVGPEYVIQLDTEGQNLPAEEPERDTGQRLAFVVTGVGREPEKGAVMERRAAAFEAAVVEAIGRAAREIQRDPKTGRSPVEFQMRLGEGLTVFGLLVGGGPRTVVLLDRRGREFELCSTKGVLAHPPHDNRIIQHVFAAAGGRLVLHKTEHDVNSRSCKADVGVYATHEAGVAASQTVVGRKPTDTRPVIATEESY